MSTPYAAPMDSRFISAALIGDRHRPDTAPGAGSATGRRRPRSATGAVRSPSRRSRWCRRWARRCRRARSPASCRAGMAVRSVWTRLRGGGVLRPVLGYAMNMAVARPRLVRTGVHRGDARGVPDGVGHGRYVPAGRRRRRRSAARRIRRRSRRRACGARRSALVSWGWVLESVKLSRIDSAGTASPSSAAAETTTAITGRRWITPAHRSDSGRRRRRRGEERQTEPVDVPAGEAEQRGQQGERADHGHQRR